jgi:hypothetical protein
MEDVREWHLPDIDAEDEHFRWAAFQTSACERANLPVNWDRRSEIMRSILGSTNLQTLLLPALVVCALLTLTGEVFVAARCYLRDQR